MGAFSSSSPVFNTKLTVPDYVEITFSACVAGGGGGGSTENADNTAAASGGGGGGYISGKVPITNIGEVFYAVGSGGNGGNTNNTDGNNGGRSYVGDNSNRIEAFGGTGGASSLGANGGTFGRSGSATNFASGNGENTVRISSDSNARAGRGGGAGRAGGNCGGPNQGANNDGIDGCSQHGGAGGHGVNVENGNNRSNGPLASCNSLGGRSGGTSGGGGGGGSRANSGGNGSNGAVYISWVTFSINGQNRDDGGPDSPIPLKSNQPITLGWKSPEVDDSDTISIENTTTTNITRTRTRTDSKGAESTIFFTISPPPRITSFIANPDEQTSGIDGVPNYNTTLSWSSTGATSASINQSIGNVSASGSTTATNLPQSTAGSNSPATITYTLTVSDGFSTDTATVTVDVYNDNTPNNFSLPNQNNVNPNTAITVSSTISGIDMVTSVNGGPGVQVSTNNSSFSSGTTITNNQTLYARVTSLGFNQSPDGLTNSNEFYVDVGTLRRFFTVTTRAPDVNETFNLPDEIDRVPYPDIDTIDEPVEQFIVSNTLDVDDIELINPSGVEIRTSNGNTQVRIKRQGASSFSGWTDVRQI